MAVAASTMPLLLASRLPAALAAPIATGDDPIGQTPPALTWIKLNDSRGIPMWNFEMSLDRGGVTSPDKFFWASITDSAWGAYRSWCALSLWFLDWVLSFSWVSTIATPLLAVGDAMQNVVNRIGLVPTFLTVTALLSGLWFLKGRFTTAIWEVGIACTIAALASGIFAHPVQLVAGPDGYIVKANQMGQQLAAELATGDSAGKTPEQLRQAQTGQLVDAFIRQPTEMINFGRVLDGGKCESAYNEVVEKGPFGTKSDIRDAVNGCDQALGDYAGNPTSAMAIGSLVFMPASFVILFMGLMIAGSVIAAALWAMFQSLKAIVTLVTGLLPGGGRGSLMLTVAETIVALLLIVFTSVFLSVFLLVVQAMFAASSGDSVAKTFVIVDVVMVVAMVIYMRQRRQIKAISQRMGQWMAQRPGGAPATRLPERQPGLSTGTVGSAVRTVAGIAATRAASRSSGRPGPTIVDNRQQAVIFAGQRPGQSSEDLPYVHAEPVPQPGGGSRPPRGRITGGPDTPPMIGGGPGGVSPSGGGLSRIATQKTARGLVRAGTSAALAYATGGASTAVTATGRLAKTARTARRMALTARMAAASTKGAAATNPFSVRPTGRPAPAAPMPIRTQPSPRPGHTRPDPQVIVGHVLSVKPGPEVPEPAPTPRTAPAPALQAQASQVPAPASSAPQRTPPTSGSTATSTSTSSTAADDRAAAPQAQRRKQYTADESGKPSPSLGRASVRQPPPASSAGVVSPVSEADKLRARLAERGRGTRRSA